MTQTVLLLGSGFVAQPTVDVLAADKDIEVIVASRTLENAKALAGTKAKAISLDVTNEAALDQAIANCDLVISLIPYTFHTLVIESAIRHKKNVVTTSYISPAIEALKPKIEAAGIVVLNEIGLDPGIDHLYAVKTIDEVHEQGGKIVSFKSYCGGVAAPEFSDNPLGYKFSWSSRGVLLALRNSARFIENGEIKEINGPDLMGTAKHYDSYFPGYAFVAYANRDSSHYRERYNIPEAQDVVRGTLRYQGFPEFIKVLVDLGFLDDTAKAHLESKQPWNKAFAQIIGAKSESEADLLAAIDSKTTFKSEEDRTRILNGLKWLDLFSTTDITPRGTPLDTLCATLEQKMQYEKGERDLVFLQHQFGIEWADKRKELRLATLVANGDPTGQPGGYSAMAKLVGVPCAVGTKRVLKGLIKPGLWAPVTRDISEPLLEDLKALGIEMIEKTVA